jgi:hypothetical protein
VSFDDFWGSYSMEDVLMFIRVLLIAYSGTHAVGVPNVASRL